MPFYTRGEQEILGTTVNDLIQNTNLTRLSPGGKARTILEGVSREFGIAYDTFDLDLLKAFLSSSSGDLLELIAALVGLQREPAEAANASEILQIQKFYVATGTFGDINNGADIYLQQNTIVSTRTESQGITYRLASPVVLSASDSEQYVAVEASVAGNDSNVGNNALVFHDFNDYQDYLNASLLTKNMHAIVNGKDFEGDTNLKYRISQRVVEAQAANETAIRLAALSVAGVADVTVYPRWRGIGTCMVLVQSVTPTVSDILLASVQGKIDRVTAEGDIAFVRGPIETGLTFELTVHYKKKLSSSELDESDKDIKTKVIEYINSFDIGEEFIVNAFAAQLFSVSDNIANIGTSNKPIDTVYIYRESAVEDNRIREILLGDYTSTETERIIIEQTVANPVTITRSFVRN